MSTDARVNAFIMDHAAAFLHAHAFTICLVIGIWIVVGTVLAKEWPMPPKDAPKWKIVAHFLLVNWPEFGRGLDGKTWMGTPFSIPFLSWTKRVEQLVDVVDKARELLHEPAVTSATVSTTTAAGDTATATAEKTPAESPSAKKDAGFIDLVFLMILGAIVFFIALVTAAGCAPTDAYVTAVRVKGDLSEALYDAHAAWIAFDQQHHADILKDATSLEDGNLRLAAWEVTEKKVDDGFVAARKAIEAYSLVLKAADADQRKDYVAAIALASEAVSTIVSLLSELGVTIQDNTVIRKPTAAIDALIALRERVQQRTFALMVDVCTNDRVVSYYPKIVCDSFKELTYGTH